MRTIYLDNAATSFPKAPGTGDAMKYYIEEVGANINRSVYRGAEVAGMTVLETREKLKELFHFPGRVTRVVLTPGNTWSLNTVLRGYLAPGDHVLTGSMEHNAVMRPLHEIPGISFSRIPADREGHILVNEAEALIRANTKLIVLCHASNVSGTIADAEALGRIAENHGIPFVLDAAQTAGHIPVDFQALRLSALCVPGHKGLKGPSGIGALLMDDAFAKNVRPLITGGTGSASDSELQPGYMPDKFESGTVNLPGIYGLHASLSWLEKTGVDSITAREAALTERLIGGVLAIPGVSLIGPKEMNCRVPVVSVDFPGLDNAEAAAALEENFGIMTRCGLHCAPNAHKSLGTFPRGTVRFSPGYFTTEEEIDTALEGIAAVARNTSRA